MRTQEPIHLTTVSSAFIEDWLIALARRCSPDDLRSLMQRSDMHHEPADITQRVTLNQITSLYQLAAVETRDEMMGLWSRPVRPRALQHLVTVLREAASLPSALYRFSTFWNLILDDFQLELSNKSDHLELRVTPNSADATPQRFGHMLILKLAHGLLSWLAGHEVPVRHVRFAFQRPAFAADYAVIFPTSVEFEAGCTSISFDPYRLGDPIKRSSQEASEFLERAPLDWIFTAGRMHMYSLRVRAFLYRTQWQTCQLPEAAAAMKMTPRTFIRRLKDEGTSFQEIKDALRRDIAILALQESKKTIDEISYENGFSSSANFHRAFRKWTGRTPASYRQSVSGIKA
ncbi:MAG: AraC family transcriptional regulator ligand-binding domain-containing protein [Pseudomonadota bacterium]